MAERAQRLAALVVVGGPLKDRRCEPEEVVTELLIGSDVDCHLHVDLPGISPIHARIWADLSGATAYDTRAPRGLFVNDDKVEGEAPIKNGDWLWLGAPGDAESVCIQCHFEDWVEVLPDAPAAAAASAAGPPESEDAPIPLVPLGSDEPMVLDGPAGEIEPAPASPVPPAPGPPAAPEAEPAPDALGFADDGLLVEAEPGVAEAPTPPSPDPLGLSDDALFLEAEPAGVGGPVPPSPPPPEPSTEPPPPAPEEAVPFVEVEPELAERPAPPEPLPEPPIESGVPLVEAEPLPRAEPATVAGTTSDASAPEADPFFVGEVPDSAAPPAPVEGTGGDDWSIPDPAGSVDAPLPEAEPSSEDGSLLEEVVAPPEELAPPEASEAPAVPPPPPPPPPSGAEAPAEDHFFIAEEILTASETPLADEPLPPDGALPTEEALFVEVEPLPEPEEVLPEPELLGRAPLPPRQGDAEAGPPPPPPPPDAEIPEPLEAPAASAPVAPPEPSVPEPPPEAAAGIETPEEISEDRSPLAPDAGEVSERAPAADRQRSPSARRAPAGRRGGRRPPRGGSPAWLRPVGIGAGLAVVGVALAIGSGQLARTNRERGAGDSVPGPRRTAGDPQRRRGFSDVASENTVLFGQVAAQVLERLLDAPRGGGARGGRRGRDRAPGGGRRDRRQPLLGAGAGVRLPGAAPARARLPTWPCPARRSCWPEPAGGSGPRAVRRPSRPRCWSVEPTEIRVRVPPDRGLRGGRSGGGLRWWRRLERGAVLRRPPPPGHRRDASVGALGRPAHDRGPRPRVRPCIERRANRWAPGADRLGSLPTELQVVVPRLDPGEPVRPVEVHVSGTEEPGRSVVEVAAAADPLELRFVAEPFDQASEQSLAVVATDLGPAFVLAAANGRSAAAARGRGPGAAERRGRLARRRARPGAGGRGTSRRSPVIGLVGSPRPSWRSPRPTPRPTTKTGPAFAGGDPVTPARLARWWEAVLRDLVLMLVRGERPRFAAALAPEGRVLQQVFDSASGESRYPPAGRGGGPILDPRAACGWSGCRVPASVTAAAPGAGCR